MTSARSHRNAFTPLALSLSVALFTFAHTALAGYTVMDDDLFPSNAIPASVAQAAQVARAQARSTQPTVQQAQSSAPTPATESETYIILFRKGIWGLNEEGNNSVLTLMPFLMQANKIVITGRPDSQPNNRLADQRAANLRSALIRNGISENKITTRTENAPTTPISGLSPVDVQVIGIPTAQPVTQPAAQQTPSRVADQLDAEILATRARATQAVSRTTIDNGIRVTTTPSSASPAATPTVAIISTPAQSPQATPDVRLDLVRQIALASQAGRIDAKIAIVTIIEMLNIQSGKPLTPTAATAAATLTPQPAPPPAPGAEFGLVAAAETARPKDWQLSNTKTLKENVVEWAAKENYTVDWKASNFFKVGTSRPLSGELLDVVDRVVIAADLEMSVWKQTREIWICDKKTDQCKKPTTPTLSDARR